MFEISWYRYSRTIRVQHRANVQVWCHFSISRRKVVRPEISDSEFKRDISMPAVSLSAFFPSPSSLAFYRDIGADR